MKSRPARGNFHSRHGDSRHPGRWVLIIPVLPKLILDFLGGGDDRRSENGALGSQVVFALMQVFLFTPCSGYCRIDSADGQSSCSPNLGLGIGLHRDGGWHRTLKLAFSSGRIISGITTSSIPTGYGLYRRCVTPREKRAGAFGLIGVAFGTIGFTFGPAIGGLGR